MLTEFHTAATPPQSYAATMFSPFERRCRPERKDYQTNRMLHPFPSRLRISLSSCSADVNIHPLSISGWHDVRKVDRHTLLSRIRSTFNEDTAAGIGYGSVGNCCGTVVNC
ncbi:hypothetical protein STAS_07003 [Striga asiatica]|uniref:Uncharacterized protein n=1 Tax=Striga asiatica TaxID=4170 RepID=A0A5A7PDI5_STRAF|nr:hypothetical protein STAS_07003 [Striga asiatica]